MSYVYQPPTSTASKVGTIILIISAVVLLAASVALAVLFANCYMARLKDENANS